MVIFGVDYGMMLTVGAAVELEELIPSHELSDFGELMDGSYTTIAENAPKLIGIMNRGYIEYMSVMHPEENVNRFDVNPGVFKIMTPGDLNKIMNEVVTVLTEGMERTVVAEAIPGKNE